MEEKIRPQKENKNQKIKKNKNNDIHSNKNPSFDHVYASVLQLTANSKAVASRVILLICEFNVKVLHYLLKHLSSLSIVAPKPVRDQTRSPVFKLPVVYFWFFVFSDFYFFLVWGNFVSRAQCSLRGLIPITSPQSA